MTNPVLREKILTVKAALEQIIDEISVDELVEAGFSRDATDRACQTVPDFCAFLETHRDELIAIEALYAVPYKRRVSFRDVKELANALARPPHQ